MCFLKIILHLFILIKIVNGKNILGLMGCASHSHELWNRVIFNELASKGYNLTILSVDISKNHPKNVHYIHLEETYNSLFKYDDKYDILGSMAAGSFEKFHYFYQYHLMACRGILRSKGFQILKNYPDDFKFDLILYDITMGPCLIGFVHKFKYPPIVGISAFKIAPANLDNVGGHIYPAYIPFFSLSYDIDMNFWERLHNTAIYIYDYLYKILIYQPQLDTMALPYYSNDTPSLIELDKLCSLILVNVHPAIDFSEPLPPNVIQVGGLKLNDDIKPLSQDIKLFLDKSKKGGILISLGTNMRNELIGKHRIMTIFNAISRLPEYNFIWKIDRQMLPEKLPQNVMIRSWISQTEILAYNKMKAFVTHSGSLSVQEAVWYSVPMVAIPLFVDQPRNAHRAMKLGFSEVLDFFSFDEEEFYVKLKKVLENSSYSENIKKFSLKFRDCPMKSLDLAIWWIEYTMRHPNLDHLKSPTLKLGFIRSNLFDVIVFTVMVFLGFTILFTKFSKLIIGNFFKEKSKNEFKKYKVN